MSHGEGASAKADRAATPSEPSQSTVVSGKAGIPCASDFPPGPWVSFYKHKYDEWHVAMPYGGSSSMLCPLASDGIMAPDPSQREATARLIAAAPDHALICWAMCVQDGRWEEWVPYDGSGEFVFAGLRYATRVDEFGCPKLTPALRRAITQSQQVPA